MFADTIAEYFVETDQVRLELEIGERDVRTFRNLLPDALHARLGLGDEALGERVQRFVAEDMPVFAGEEQLEGRVTDIRPALRPLRDSITGEALPTSEDAAIPVIRATVVYPFDARPDALTLTTPAVTGAASIGFVLYHLGVAVNDFRYLGSGFTVELDWEDPWYSAFSRASLRREYYAAMTGFIYVEPYEVRKEIIVRPADIQRYIDLELDGSSVIPPERQDDIKASVVEFLRDYFPVVIDGEPAEGSIDRINFLDRTLRSSDVVDGQDIELLSATLGVIYVFPTDGLPDLVEMTWDLFDERTPRVPAASVDEAGALPTILEPDFPVLKWQNFLQSPQMPTLVDLELPPTGLQLASSWARWLSLGVFGLLLFAFIRATRGETGRQPVLGALCLVIAASSVFLFYQHRQQALDDARLGRLVGDLLHNVYRAFDYRGEEAIYDALARSVSGELLTDIYLETRKGLELANQGGAQVKVKTTEVLAARLNERSGNRLDIDGEWNVAGSVGHWGHIHERINRYTANIEISEIDGVWKLTGIEILDEKAALTGMIEIRDLEFMYADPAAAGQSGFRLRIESLDVERGSRTALVGPSGSGKSTLLGLIAGTLTPVHGQVRIGDQAITSLGERPVGQFRVRHIGQVFQAFELLSYLTVLENVMLPWHIAREGSRAEAAARASELLESVGLGQKSRSRPAQLSQGEQQRVAVCRAMFNRPPVLLADEPTGNLDNANKQQVVDLLCEQAVSQGSTLLMVTHDESLLERFDAVLDMSDVAQPGGGPELT